MKALVAVLAAAALLALSTLAIMNNACKSGQHDWCAPMATVRHHTNWTRLTSWSHRSQRSE